MVSSTLRPHFNPGKDPVPILQEAGWAPGPVWTGGKSRSHRDSIPERPARSSVAMPTELPGPHITIKKHNNNHYYHHYYVSQIKASVMVDEYKLLFRKTDEKIMDGSIFTSVEFSSNKEVFQNYRLIC